ncbi:hypothetical protein CDD83_4456 [Cordyceps sp. RAO-2017]|nr:hypothetical protein CDD83_4456 [Cordyceps sp. RAO-2017]
MFPIQATPARQSASDTINVLSRRLISATLLEDRRAAILGLRSFAKDFPASVASGALRGLIGSLAEDGEDVDTVKVVMETLLILLNPNDSSPEASQEIVLWLADEFTQHQENSWILLNLLESTDFYSRLYSLQLLGAILVSRTQRTEECVLTAPFGVSRLVAALDDQREAIRNEAISLLTAFTSTSIEIQKLVAFENAFERLLAIVVADGSLTEGGRIVEDCLILLANLLRFNTSNQVLFRESGCMSKLANILEDTVKAQTSGRDIAAWAYIQRSRNIYAFLAVMRLFLHSEATGASLNQMVLWKHGVVHHVLQFAFSDAIGDSPIRVEAFLTCGDLIRNAPELQESFAQLTVSHPLQFSVTPEEPPSRNDTLFVIDGLLDVILNTHDQSKFDIRFAACECLKSYFSNHSDVKMHFLTRAIEGYHQRPNESTNVLTVLMRQTDAHSVSDSYRPWFAAVIVFHLLYENSSAKAKALELREGDSARGEEVVSGIQTISAILLSGMARGENPRSLTGYLMLLVSWMFEDFDAVNDFLAEGSNVQGLIQAVVQPQTNGADVIQGLSATLLGVLYEFSTKDSPVPRTKLHSIILSRLGRDKYLDCVKRLRRNPLIRDFEVSAREQNASSLDGFPSVYFDAEFVAFFKDNYSRISRAIDRAPEMEISIVANGIQKGISRELVDSLRRQVDDMRRVLEDANARTALLEDQLHNERAENQSSTDRAAVTLSTIQDAYDELEKSHNTELSILQTQLLAEKSRYESQMSSTRAEFAAQELAHREGLVQARKDAEVEQESKRLNLAAETEELRGTIRRLEGEVTKVDHRAKEQLQTLREGNDKLLVHYVSEAEQAEEKSEALQSQLDAAKTTIEELKKKLEIAESEKHNLVESKAALQAELDDILILFSDLEEKVHKYENL